MPDDVKTVLHRFIDEYGWAWQISRDIINRTFGAEYTTAELQEIYREE